jgi:TonB family protein
MPDPSRIAQARILEIPVTIQGSKPVNGSNQRELFEEATKTTLVFDNGAVLNLKSRVAVGQSVFLRNENSGREVLCKVLEAPGEGQPGYTDLEFNAPDPAFWGDENSSPNAPLSASDAPQSQEPSAHEDGPVAPQALRASTVLPGVTIRPESESAHAESQTVVATLEAPADASSDTLAMMSSTSDQVTLPSKPMSEEEAAEAEAAAANVPPSLGVAKTSLVNELASTHESIPAPEGADTSFVASEPTGEQIDAALRKMTGAPATAAQRAMENLIAGHEVDPHAKDEQTLAAMLARDARRARIDREKEAARAAKTGGGDAASAVDLEAGATPGEEVFVPKMHWSEKMVTGRNATIVEIVAAVIIVVCVGFIWRAVQPVFFPTEGPLAVVKQPAKKPSAAAMKAGAAPAAPKASANSAPSAAKNNAQSAIKVEPPSGKSSSGSNPPPSADNVATNPTTASTTTAPETKPEVIVQPSEAQIVVNESHSSIAANAAAEEPAPKPEEHVAPRNTPAKIVAESQPAFPAWAKELDVDGVVKLDALIDENGNVTQTTVISGPRALQHAAQQAVGVWLFQPAMADGKPVASHMTLTIEFQR